MRILLVRHGESAGNVDPSVHARMADHAIPLSERGREQARVAGEKLDAHFREVYGSPAERPPIRLWVSPYKRTRETGAGIVETAGQWLMDSREHVLLCEQQFGLFDGVPDEELPIRFPNESAHYDKCCRFEGKFWARMPLGESRFDVALRVHQAFGTFQRDAEDHDIHDIVVICHGVTLRAFVMMWCHRSPEWFEDERNPNNCAVRLIDGDGDQGYMFEGFPRREP
ncbi:MAG: histidine phosphatase family protein [Myxococcales bacterium]|nr:histidine phosphatase family protein [Myxococcales bacterium]MCB9579955.1 histidine phosphatase family protein [Polyangiaceae bacterium]